MTWLIVSLSAIRGSLDVRSDAEKTPPVWPYRSPFRPNTSMFRHLAFHDFFRAYRTEELLLKKEWTERQKRVAVAGTVRRAVRRVEDGSLILVSPSITFSVALRWRSLNEGRAALESSGQPEACRGSSHRAASRAQTGCHPRPRGSRAGGRRRQGGWPYRPYWISCLVRCRSDVTLDHPFSPLEPPRFKFQSLVDRGAGRKS